MLRAARRRRTRGTARRRSTRSSRSRAASTGSRSSGSPADRRRPSAASTARGRTRTAAGSTSGSRRRGRLACGPAAASPRLVVDLASARRGWLLGDVAEHADARTRARGCRARRRARRARRRPPRCTVRDPVRDASYLPASVPQLACRSMIDAGADAHREHGLHRAEEAHGREQIVADLAHVRAEAEQQREHERGRPQPAEKLRAREQRCAIGSASVSSGSAMPTSCGWKSRILPLAVPLPEALEAGADLVGDAMREAAEALAIDRRAAAMTGSHVIDEQHARGSRRATSSRQHRRARRRRPSARRASREDAARSQRRDRANSAIEQPAASAARATPASTARPSVTPANGWHRNDERAPRDRAARGSCRRCSQRHGVAERERERAERPRLRVEADLERAGVAGAPARLAVHERDAERGDDGLPRRRAEQAHAAIRARRGASTSGSTTLSWNQNRWWPKIAAGSADASCGSTW